MNTSSVTSRKYDEFKSYDKYFTNNEGNELFITLGKPEIIQDPYPYYHYLYSKGPINWTPDKTLPSKGRYMIHDYKIIEELFKSPKLGNDESYANWTEEDRVKIAKMYQINPALRMANKWLINIDPPDHTKMRTFMNKVFTPKRVRELAEPIKDITNSLIDSIDGKNGFNLLNEFAYPLPIYVIASLLGVPNEHLQTFKNWAKIILTLFNQLELNPEQKALANNEVLEMEKYFGGLLQERKKDPKDDLISSLAMEDETEVSQEAIIANLILLLFAGHETTMNLIGNGTYHLLKHPDQISMLQNDASLYPNAVEESLRYDSPVQYDFRRSYADFEFDGYEIKAGYPIGMMIGSANRNESSNPDPDTYDITRKNIKHLSFARGIHYCLGAPLARLEGKIAFETLFTKFKDLHLTEEPKYRLHPAFRGLQSLKVKN